jgi:hypothetical protein
MVLVRCGVSAFQIVRRPLFQFTAAPDFPLEYCHLVRVSESADILTLNIKEPVCPAAYGGGDM